MQSPSPPASPASEPDVSSSPRPPLPRWRRVGGHAVRAAVDVYRRHGAAGPPLFFFGGVTWDALTLRRIDAWLDNTLLLVYLAALGVLIVAATLVEAGKAVHPVLDRRREWLPAGIQFFLGALFSAYVVFYFQSASLTPTSVFLLVLVALLVVNEFIHRRIVHLYLLLALYFLAACSYFIFFVPVVLRRMDYYTFVLGGMLALALVTAMLRFLHRHDVFERPRQVLLAAGLVLGLFGLLNLFYVQNWIPPVPMALRYGGVFHAAERDGDVFVLEHERRPWWAVWRPSNPVFHRAPGEPVYVFAAVFAPTRLEKEIVHEWQVWDEAAERWETTDRIAYDVIGGRDDGFRGFTLKRHVRPGRWRVDVETHDGRVLGRVRFRIAAVDEPVPLREVRYE